MQFIRSEELKPGLRIAKPIYNKDGVLLYERNARLTIPAINSVQNFELTGIYILEPTEPVPALTDTDLEFEQAQMVYLFKLKDLFEKIYKRQSLEPLDFLVTDIIKRFGNINYHINFNQNLRTSEDFMYKHATSVAILSALIGQRIDIPEEDFKALIAASMLYCFGYRFTAKKAMDKQSALEKGTVYLNMSTDHTSYLPKASRVVEYFILSNNPERSVEPPSEDILLLSEILKVVVEFDTLTCMTTEQESLSEMLALNTLRKHTNDFNASILNILESCLYLVPAGAMVKLNNNEKAVVLEENRTNYMQPVIFRLRDQSICDLSDPTVIQRLHIEDLVKTEDNRISLQPEILKQYNERKNTQS